MRHWPVFPCLATVLLVLGCQGDDAALSPSPTLPEASDVGVADAGDEPEALDASAEDAPAEAAEAGEPDAAACGDFTAKASCGVDGWCFTSVPCFVMGSPPEEPGHDALEAQVPVSFKYPWRTLPHEVSIEEWTALGFPVPTGMDEDVVACTDPDCPVTGVTWFEALAFANAYTEHDQLPLEKCYELDGCTGAVGQGMVCQTVTPVHKQDGFCSGYRVPTSAEWEAAARAGTTTAFYDGPNDAVPDASPCATEPHLDGIGWYCGNSGGPPATHPSGTKDDNPFLLVDMSGNAAEWVSDSYPAQPLSPDPQLALLSGVAADGPGQLRGGHAGSQPWDARSASRASAPKDARRSSVGFRLVQMVVIHQQP